MSLNPKLAVARRNAALDNILSNANNGVLRIYDGTQPADADTAPTGAEHILAELTMGATAFASADSGVALANTITADSDANATGTATWFRLFKTDGTTVIMDGSVGAASGYNINLNSVAIQIHAAVSVTSFSVTFPA